MDLFRQAIDQPENLLPVDGKAKYYGLLLPLNSADSYFQRLMATIEWKSDQAVIYGKRITTKRKVAWYADQPFEYSYSNTTKKALPWTRELLELKKLVESKTCEQFNSCLLNLYHDGGEGMAWHSDGEKDLKKNGTIASLSFGAERKFLLRHNTTKHKVAVVLEHGSLLTMEGTTQSYWQHRLPTTTKITEPRINLTFRTIVKQEE